MATCGGRGIAHAAAALLVVAVVALLCGSGVSAAAAPDVSYRTSAPNTSSSTYATETQTQYEAYLDERAALLVEEQSMSFVDALTTASLTDKEQYISAAMHALKEAEKADNVNQFPPAHSFYTVRDIIDASPVKALLDTLPKGGLLHMHSSSMYSNEFFVQNGTYRDECYMYVAVGDSTDSWTNGTFKFFPIPDTATMDAQWQQVNALRAAADDVTAFDAQLLAGLVMSADSYTNVCDDESGQAWEQLQPLFAILGPASDYVPYRRDYMYNGYLDMIRNQGVSYVEMRWSGDGLYGEDAVTLSRSEAMAVEVEVIEAVRALYPSFNARFIQQKTRTYSQSVVYDDMLATLELREEFPDYVAGYDLVGQEDLGKQLLQFAEPCLAVQNVARNSYGGELAFFFHAGESDWEYTDQNLYDALLLGAKRIGHGFGLEAHPLLIDMIRERGVAVEVNPISNQLLRYVADLRNHPAKQLIARGVPVVLSADDPAMFGADSAGGGGGVVYDWYMAYVAWPLNLDGLKQLAINSLVHSSLTGDALHTQLAVWESDWYAWVDTTYDAMLASASSSATSSSNSSSSRRSMRVR